jgi:hypothetical protein
VSVPAGDCAWCKGYEDFEPFDSDDADQTLCESHVAEFEGVSLDGLQRMAQQDLVNMADLGCFDD